MDSPKSLKGRFLVAGPKLQDRNFFKTVVLMLEHSGDGAMGLVVNRPSSLSVANAVSGHIEIPDDGEAVFAGGPVEPADLFLLHEDRSLDGQSVEVVDDVFVTTAAPAFEKVLEPAAVPRARRVLCGYAGWSPGQLENELRTGDWMSVEATAEALFDTDPYELWDELKADLTSRHRLVADGATHPDWN